MSLRTYIVAFLTLFFITTVIGQQKRIQILHADNSTIDEEKYPGATVLLGNVYVLHEGVELRSKKAIHYKNRNFLKAFGDVTLTQGDTIVQTSRYVEYSGNTKKALSWGDVVLKDPVMTLTTDTLRFDRLKQLLYYKSGATIKDTANVLVSKVGNYFLETTRFQALSDVVLTNPDYVLESNHLDYYTNNGQAFLFGPSTITGKDNKIYTERGFYDTATDISHFTENSIIEYGDRTLTADSLYYNRTTGFASATKNIQIKDTVNNSVIRGNYAEYYQLVDSAFVIDRAVAVSEIEKDSIYIHGDTLLVTGKSDKRIIRGYHNVKFFKTNLRGKCDSIHSNQATGLTQLFKNPVLWSEDSQITGDTIHLLSNPKTEKLDSLKVLRNAFIIKKDSAGFNQIKGRNILGKFVDNDLYDVNVIGNGEVIQFVRDDRTQELIGIDKTTCSSINFKLKENKIQSTTFFTKPEGATYPLSEYPENLLKLRGFIWRENEKPLTKDDIFSEDINSNKEYEAKYNQGVKSPIKTPDDKKLSKKVNTLAVDPDKKEN